LIRSRDGKQFFDAKGAWIQYNNVDFGKKKSTSVKVRAASKTGATLQLRLNAIDGPVVAEVKIPNNNEWKITKASLSGFQQGINNFGRSVKGQCQC
jgi:hypothetical protein